jgi:hypothetical protein
VITKQTAYDIYIAYDEIAKGEKLLADMENAIKKGEAVDLRDHFGRRQGLSLTHAIRCRPGTGDSGHSRPRRQQAGGTCRHQCAG